MSPKLTQSRLVRLESDLDELLLQESKARRVSAAFVIREALRERYELVPSKHAPRNAVNGPSCDEALVPVGRDTKAR